MSAHERSAQTPFTLPGASRPKVCSRCWIVAIATGRLLLKDVKFFKQRFSAAPEGTAALFFIQIFSTLGFAVLYSTLVLYATKHLQLPAKVATALMGVFGAFNYGLHLFGGYLGGRFLSNRNLFVGGMALQVIGCACISTGTLAMFYLGLALFLTGSGLNVTCINMMLTQRFTPEDPRREGAFLWNYAGMNIGFFVGFSAAGYFQATESYSSLFIFATLGNFGAIVLALFNWKTLADRNTPLLDVTPKQFRLRQLAGIAILIGLVPVVWFMLQRPGSTETILKAICGAVALTLIYLTLRHRDRRERRNMTAYLILTLGSLVFWSLYQMAPNGLKLFAVNNVDLMIGRVQIPPQWIQNINTVCIVLGGPLLASLFAQLRARGWSIDIPKQFAASLLLMGLAFLILPIGIKLAGADGKSAFVWLFASYVLQSMGELLISADRIRDDRQARAEAVSGHHDGQLDARDRAGVAVRGRFFGHDPGAERHDGGRDQPRVHEAVRRARRGQPRGRRRARAADSVPAQADHRQGRDAA